MARYNSQPLPSELHDVLQSAMRAEKECLEAFSSSSSRSASHAPNVSRSRLFGVGLRAGTEADTEIIDRKGRPGRSDEETEIRKIETKVAIRDKSPHLFEIIPLREARGRDDFNVCTASPSFLSSNSFGSSSTIKDSLLHFSPSFGSSSNIKDFPAPLSPTVSRFTSSRDYVPFSPLVDSKQNTSNPPPSGCQPQNNSTPRLPLIHFDLVPRSHGKTVNDDNNRSVDRVQIDALDSSVGHENHDDVSISSMDPPLSALPLEDQACVSPTQLSYNLDESPSSTAPSNIAIEGSLKRRHSERRIQLVSLAEARARQAAKRFESWPPIATKTADSLQAANSSQVVSVPMGKPCISNNSESDTTSTAHQSAILHGPTTVFPPARSVCNQSPTEVRHISMLGSSSEAALRARSKRFPGTGDKRNRSLSDIERPDIAVPSTTSSFVKPDGRIQSKSARRKGVVFGNALEMSPDVQLWQSSSPHILLPAIQPLRVEHNQQDNVKLDLTIAAQDQEDQENMIRTAQDSSATKNHGGFSLHPGGHATAPLLTDRGIRHALCPIDVNTSPSLAGPRSLDSSAKHARGSNAPLNSSCSAPTPFTLGVPAESTLLLQRNAAKRTTKGGRDGKVVYPSIICELFLMLDEAIAEWVTPCSM